jgi:hypothetical protein
LSGYGIGWTAAGLVLPLRKVRQPALNQDRRIPPAGSYE